MHTIQCIWDDLHTGVEYITDPGNNHEMDPWSSTKDLRRDTRERGIWSGSIEFPHPC